MNETVNPMIQTLEERASLPFAPVSDDVFIGVLLVVFFLLAFALSDSTCYLKQLVSRYSIGHPQSQSDEMRTSRSFLMRLLLILSASLCMALAAVVCLHAFGAVTTRPQAAPSSVTGPS